MAAGLFASLFAASSSGPASEVVGRERSPTRSLSESGETTDELEHQSPITSHHDADAIDAEASDAKSTESSADHISLKEAQEVADVDMQLSSPPSSPPAAPPTPHHAPTPHASLLSATRGPRSSISEKPLSHGSPLSTPAPERDQSIGRPSPSSTPAVQRSSRRRTMPARLSQVSSLLAGSSLEEELLMLETPSSPSGSTFHNAPGTNSTGAASSTARNGASSSSYTSAAPSSYFASSSIVVLTSDPRVLERAVFANVTPSSLDGRTTNEAKVKTEQFESDLTAPAQVPTPSESLNHPAPSSSLVSTLAIKRQQLIETPDFKQRDDTLYMPKTRGLRSEAAEDTSDAAYERRHRKPEAAEKRQKKAEVDRLTRDRHKLLSRIEQLKLAEARMLQPIVVARDQVRAEAGGQKDDATQPDPDVKPLHERIEDVRKELLDDAYETLKRYDLLLSISSDAKPASPGPLAQTSKIDSTSAAANDDAARSQSPRLKIRIKGGRATWDTAESASPTGRQTPVLNERSDVSRRVSARQPKLRVESLPTPLTAAAVEAVEHSRRRRRRLSSPHEEASPAHRKASAARTTRTSPSRGRITSDTESPDRPMRRRSSPETGGTYKAKYTSREAEGDSASGRTNGRPRRAAAAAAALASARQRRVSERFFSDFDYDDDEGDDSAGDDAETSLHQHNAVAGTRRASQSPRRSPLARDRRSTSASSTTSSISSMASSLGYMYPTVAETGSLKVSHSLAELDTTDPAATLRPLPADDGARKKIKLALSSSAAALGGEEKKRLSQVLDTHVEQETSDREQGRPLGGPLTESEAESILAAFLGTTPIGKTAKADAPVQPTDTPSEVSSIAASTKATAAIASPAATQSSNASPSKRRSSRRDNTQSFGERLPDLLTKTAAFDFSVMGYFQSIDRPKKGDEVSEMEEDQYN